MAEETAKETTLPDAAKKAKKRRTSGGRRHITVSVEAHRLLLESAAEFGVTAAEYGSSCIRYFAERGLDPMKNQEREGIAIQRRLGEVEELVVKLGNRLFGWLTQHEKNVNRSAEYLHRDLFGFLRGHEKSLFSYLETQASHVHEHLSDQEELFLLPLMRELLLTNVEALYGRRLGEQIMLKVLGRDLSEYPSKHQEFNQRRDADMKQRLDAFISKLIPPLPAGKNAPPLTPVPERPNLTGKADPKAAKAAVETEPKTPSPETF
ncbi:hypothetical protein LRS06_21675 [Hymenobacter sp. J193]|uniref:hypothetical protein n=1 Tax=Hymenobacter sp. J193 TaxID=2898429 RepID=UPI0021507D6C|nr:hypothetical protein [Hymenobacter sp. J193]MCR5890340.1 hypothetical protein [Hymenobacter sp. J193]